MNLFLFKLSLIFNILLSFFSHRNLLKLINKNRDDMEMMLNRIVPEGLAYRHSCEGPDDMVSDYN